MRMPACVLRSLRGAVAISASCMAIVCVMGASLNAQESLSDSSQGVPQSAQPQRVLEAACQARLVVVWFKTGPP